MDNEEATAYARRLMLEAIDRLDSNNPEGAVWRMMDATGILEDVYPHPDPTGRGYQIRNVHTEKEG